MVPFIPAPRELAQDELSNLDDAIDALATALGDLTHARELLTTAEARVELCRQRCRLLELAVRVATAAERT